MTMRLPEIFVWSDNPQRINELVATGRQWAERVHLLFVGDEEQLQEQRHCGIDVIHHFSPQHDVLVEDYVLSFARVIETTGTRGLVLMPSTKRGKAIAAKLGVRLNAAVINDMADLRITDDQLTSSHQFYGGLAHANVQLHSAWSVVTCGSGHVVEMAPSVSVAATVLTAGFVSPAHPIRFVSRKEKAASQVDLSKAKCVVGVGRGFAKQDDLALASALATALRGEVGCSQPIAEGEGWMEQERYIGVSGVALSANIYVAVGISGQIQHMVGVNRVKTIVAINKDKNAPIFSAADYGIVGDIYKILPELTKKLAV
ncbi:electron transfer flavoprotein subunit alpha [Escherichia albertii]|nr:electron transfer flavoprotein subunit alpha [Escherichia albertii]